jgi:hypothetical protein
MHFTLILHALHSTSTYTPLFAALHRTLPLLPTPHYSSPLHTPCHSPLLPTTLPTHHSPRYSPPFPATLRHSSTTTPHTHCVCYSAPGGWMTVESTARTPDKIRGLWQVHDGTYYTTPLRTILPCTMHSLKLLNYAKPSVRSPT